MSDILCGIGTQHDPHAWGDLNWCPGNPLTLTDFLLARIAEDEAELAEGRSHWMHGDDSHYVRDRWLQFNPDDMNVSVGYGRVLAECEAKRRIIHDWDTPIPDFDGAVHLTEDAEHLFRLLALPYADHPDYREEWRP